MVSGRSVLVSGCGVLVSGLAIWSWCLVVVSGHGVLVSGCGVCPSAVDAQKIILQTFSGLTLVPQPPSSSSSHACTTK